MADKPTHKDSNPSSQKSSVSSTENPAHSQLESIRFLVASPEPLKMTETSTQPATKDNSQPAVESSRDHTRSRAPSVPSTTLLDELDEPAETVAVGIGANTGTAKAGTPVHDISRNTQDSDSEAGSMIEDMPFPQTTPPFDDESSITSGFKIGFAEDKNKKYRRTMEDAHAYFYNFGNTTGSGWFAIFDGHAGRTAAEWCGSHLHETFEKLLQENPSASIPELLNRSFLATDSQLGDRKGSYSGCTAVVAFLRTEDRPYNDVHISSNANGTKLRKRRVLYTANVGDARAVLCRDGKAIRLSYDHKGSDPAEAKRIVESGGFVMNNRVNGVLAVTRSLGDITMKEWIIGSPYTTETVLDEKDSFLILACDGIWDVCSDQTATDLIRDVTDPQQAAEDLLDYALENFSTDNLSVLIVRLNQEYLHET